MINLPRLYTRQDLAAALQVHPITICRWHRSGRILAPDIKFGNFVRWQASTFRKILVNLTHEKSSVRISRTIKKAS
jgi:predicted site-specific integrase-resolvase